MTPGWKFNEWELKGRAVVRVEVGPRDLAEGKVLSVRRDTFEKAPLDIEGLEGEIKAMLDAIQTNMFRNRPRVPATSTPPTCTAWEELEKAGERRLRQGHVVR